MKQDNSKINEVLKQLGTRLPADWTSTRKSFPAGERFGPDLLLEIKAPNGESVKVAVEFKNRLEPNGAANAAAQLRSYTSELGKNAVGLLTSSFISSSTQTRLKELEISYADATGNIWMSVSKPGLYIETQGAARNPDRKNRPARSLKGAKAARIVRILCDRSPPFGVRNLAETADVDPGYVSRVLAFLETEDLIVRENRGPVTKIRWRKLIERWSQDYTFFKSNRVLSYLEPRDITQLPEKLSSLKSRSAITGSSVASMVAPVAPARMIAAFVDSPESIAEEMELRPADFGSNVLLAEPYDAFVFEHVQWNKGVAFAAFPQVAVDLMTMPDRGPEEAKALLEWMETNDTWRS